jgi:hypothetical protein
MNEDMRIKINITLKKKCTHSGHVDYRNKGYIYKRRLKNEQTIFMKRQCQN